MRTAFLALMLATADGSANAADAGFHAIALPHRRKGLSSRASIADAVAQSAARAGATLRGAVRRAAVAIAGYVSGRADYAHAGRVSGRWWGCAAVLALAGSPAAADSIVATRITQSAGQGAGTATVGPATLFSASVSPSTGQGAGWMEFFDAITPPADGAVSPLACFYVSAGPRTTSFNMGNYPVSMSTGISWAFSSSSDCTTLTRATVSFVSVVFR